MTQRPLVPTMEPAKLTWQNGVPQSVRFDDVYFSRDNGLAETRHVFINSNRLGERFQALPQNSHFVVAETGFGTGLNFLATCSAWLASRPARDNSILHFISVERFPLTRTDLRKALALWPELSHLAEEFIEHYPALIQGTHRLVLANGHIRLTLYFGDVADGLRNLTFQADAWFLDGFSPALNPEMWFDDAIQQICLHSKPGTTLATFTAAGRIRRALAAAGFEMQKVAGFGRKRDMLFGCFKPSEATPPVRFSQAKPIIIIGAGIAGATLAYNLAHRGHPVTVLDEAAAPGAAASGNLQGALYVKLGIEYNSQTELAATALQFSQRFYRPWQKKFWHPTGLLQLATNPQEQERQRRFLQRNQYPADFLRPVTAKDASRLAELDIEHSGLWFPGSGWVQPAQACKTLLRHPGITFIPGFQVNSLYPSAVGWTIQSSQGEFMQADKVVIASGHRSGSLLPAASHLRLKPIRGQVSVLSAAEFNLPRVVVCGSRYLNPAHQGKAVIGATFDLHDPDPGVKPASDQENLQALADMLPAITRNQQHAQLPEEARVAFRCSTHDYQPAAGQVHQPGQKATDGLYLFTGLGSKGLTWAPLLAEYLADVITQQPLCLPLPLVHRLETGRLYQT